jgi:hypothetical protein
LRHHRRPEDHDCESDENTHRFVHVPHLGFVVSRNSLRGVYTGRSPARNLCRVSFIIPRWGGVQFKLGQGERSISGNVSVAGTAVDDSSRYGRYQAAFEGNLRDGFVDP